MGGMMGGSGIGVGGLGLIGIILNLVITVGVIVGVVVLVVWLVRRVGSEGAGGSPGRFAAGSQSNPKEILQTRYARGEITREEYKAILSDLS